MPTLCWTRWLKTNRKMNPRLLFYLQSALQGMGFQISESALIQFLKLCHDNYDKPAYVGKLPGVMYVEESRSFVVCV